MEIIREEDINCELKEKGFSWYFEVEKQGIYGIEITASAKSWWQNFLRLRLFFKDDDLTVKIDGIAFPKKSGKRGLFDGEVAWNGNNLKGLKKTNFFIIKLQSGKHTLDFLVDQSPKLEKIKIYQIGESEISYLPKDNLPIEDGNRRQWLTIILVNLDLNFLKIKASAKQGKRFLIFKRDDSDLKLIINGEIQKNKEPKSHKNWYWCGRTLKGKEKIFEKELDLKPALHYIELWADRTPKVQEIKVRISEKIICPVFTLDDVQTYTYKGVKRDEDYNRFDKEILEAVNEWNKHFFAQEYPPKEPLHPNLVKAMIYVETRMGYYIPPEEYYPSYPDVMQVADPRNPAIHTLNNDGWIDPETGKVAREYEIVEGKEEVLDYKGQANGSTPKESIYWGVRWLYHKAQGITENKKRYWRSWEKAVRNYRHQDDYDYQEKVYKIYHKGITPTGIKLWSILLIPFIAFSAFGLWIALNQGKVYFSFKGINQKGDYQIIVNILDGLWFKKVHLATTYANGANSFALDKNKPIKFMYWDLNNDGEEELIITGRYYGIGPTKYILSKIDDEWQIIHNIGLYGGLRPAFKSHNIIFDNLDKTGALEVIEQFCIPYSNASDELWEDYYQFDDEEKIYKFIKRVKTKLD